MTVAIIGAGVAGLVAAYSLNGMTDVTVFEKSRGVGGRAATRWHDLPDGQRVYIDHGAQYIKDDSPVMHQFLHDILPTDELTDIGRPVWLFDAANQISEGDPGQNSAPKYSYKHGLATLGKLIVQAGGLTVKQGVRVGRLEWVQHQYRLWDENEVDLGRYDHVLIAIPSGQAAELITKSNFPPIETRALLDALARATYRPCITATLGFARVINQRPYYALLDTSREHAISWLAFEHAKPGHVPPGHSVLIAQMAGAYSTEHWDTDPATVIADIADRVSTLLGEDLHTPDWTEYQKWRYSLPDRTISEVELNMCMRGLWFAGDWNRGGRVHQAAQVGFEVGGMISNKIG